MDPKRSETTAKPDFGGRRRELQGWRPAVERPIRSGSCTGPRSIAVIRRSSQPEAAAGFGRAPVAATVPGGGTGQTH